MWQQSLSPHQTWWCCLLSFICSLPTHSLPCLLPFHHFCHLLAQFRPPRRCNSSSTTEYETHSIPDWSVTSNSLSILKFTLCHLVFNPHLVILRPSFLSPFLPIFNGHHSNYRTISLLIHSMCCTSMHCGSSFPFHPTTTALFHYTSTSLVTTPLADSTSCPCSTSQRIGFSHNLCLRHRCTPFFIFYSYCHGHCKDPYSLVITTRVRSNW